MIYQLLPESPKSGQIDRCRFGSKAYCMAIASVVFYVVFFVFTGEAGDTSRDGTISGLNGSIAKDVSSGFVINQSNQAVGSVEKIVLLGERHCGTNWITQHLQDCFGSNIEVTPHYTRFKHWFQKEELYSGAPNSVVVVALFRDPFDWVWAMKERPHHAHDHIGLPWLEFVTKPWIGKRGPYDHNISQVPGMKKTVTCFSQFSFVEVMPCSKEDSPKVVGHADYKYELLHDGSERAYSSIIDLRKEKIENHLSTSAYNATRAFYPFRYEDLESNGTELLLSLLEKTTGIKPHCKSSEPMGTVKHKEVPKEFVNWMNKYVDWGVEARIGYYPRE